MSNNLDKVSAKILVLGDSGVGKSSLIYLICHSATLSSAQWTIGCSIDVKLHDNYFLEFWDIGGSRNHKIARSFLYQEYHGIILVFDATNNKSRLNLNEWLMEVTQKSNDKDLETYVNINVPIITIATKKDLIPYGGALETTDTLNYPIRLNKSSEHSSVVNFSENSLTTTAAGNYTYRRHQSSVQQTTSPVVSRFNSTHSLSSQAYATLSSSSLPSSSSPPSVYSNDSPSEVNNQVIYINTQDALSFNLGSRNCNRLNSFFKQVIDRRNKKFYNKFAI